MFATRTARLCCAGCGVYGVSVSGSGVLIFQLLFVIANRAVPAVFLTVYMTLSFALCIDTKLFPYFCQGLQFSGHELFYILSTTVDCRHMSGCRGCTSANQSCRRLR